MAKRLKKGTRAKDPTANLNQPLKSKLHGTRRVSVGELILRRLEERPSRGADLKIRGYRYGTVRNALAALVRGGLVKNEEHVYSIKEEKK